MAGLTLAGLEDKVAVVTGAGRMRSIGRPIAVELAGAGSDAVLTGTGRPPERYPDDEKAAGWRGIDSVAEEIRALGRRALPVVSDVSDAGAVDLLTERAVAEMGRIDTVVNNAGAARGADRVPVVELDVDVWHTRVKRSPGWSSTSAPTRVRGSPGSSTPSMAGPCPGADRRKNCGHSHPP